MLIKGLVGHSSQGLYKGWAKDAQHRAECKAYNIFPDFVKDENTLPPWRLSKSALKTVDRRVCSMWWPHYVDKLCREGKSFWTASDRMWKATHKEYVLMVDKSDELVDCESCPILMIFVTKFIKEHGL